jgi:protein-tyrosine phosphatase
LTVLLVYLMVFEDAPDRAEIEHVIENAMTGHVQLTGSTELEREQILKVRTLSSHDGLICSRTGWR